MKQKKGMKLSLNKITVSNLDTGALEKIRGGDVVIFDDGNITSVLSWKLSCLKSCDGTCIYLPPPSVNCE